MHDEAVVEAQLGHALTFRNLTDPTRAHIIVVRSKRTLQPRHPYG